MTSHPNLNRRPLFWMSILAVVASSELSILANSLNVDEYADSIIPLGEAELCIVKNSKGCTEMQITHNNKIISPICELRKDEFIQRIVLSESKEMALLLIMEKWSIGFNYSGLLFFQKSKNRSSVSYTVRWLFPAVPAYKGYTTGKVQDGVDRIPR
jgi:hypothetical protein